MSYITNKQDGFTLVEIAIVLVIIGVLLGGVLKGQELIKSAQVRNLIDQSSSIQAAYYGFVDRYHQIPGDMRGNAACSLIGNQGPNCVGGNGNRVIEKNNWKEASAVWAHLAAAGFIQGNYQGSATDETTYRDPAQAPANAFGGLLVLSRSNCYLSSPTTPSPPKLNLVLGRNLPVSIIQQFDVKVDDGLPATGTVRATGGDCFVGETGQDDSNCVTKGTPPIWDINKDSSDCNAVVLY
jgi:prepilin-type N-terminal cleavage/methylation domain-containing protein